MDRARRHDSPRARQTGLASGRVNAASLPGVEIQHHRFSAHSRLLAHRHEHPSVALVLAGSYQGALGARSWIDGRGHATTIPVGESHHEQIGPDGASAILLIVTGNRGRELPAGALDGLHHVRDAELGRLARRLECELDQRDEVQSLCLEGLALEALATAFRARESKSSPRPAWLERCRELLDDAFREPLSLERIATEVGVSRPHLARTFRRAYGCSIGEYVRTRRIDACAERLRSDETPLAAVALDHGFYDQSHFTAWFRRHLGCTPGEYRKHYRR